MIYLILFWEFFKIGLLAVGGGLATLPFLFELAEKYPWFDVKTLTDMVAISESTPGPLGVNMATYAGFSAAGISGGIVATLGLVVPSLLIIILLAKAMNRCRENCRVQRVFYFIRPAVVALILGASWHLAKLAVFDAKTALICLGMFAAVHYFKRSPILYICAGAVLGIVLKL